MTDWSAHLGRGRRFLENLAWIGAAALVTLVLATTAALAMWLDRRAGDGQANTVMIDLPPLPVAEAVADDPGPQPETAAAAPDTPDAPDTDEPPQPELAEDVPPETEQPDMPELEEVAEALPETDEPPPPPEPEPEPEPVKKAEVQLPKPEKKVQKKPPPKKQVERAPEAAEAQGRKSAASEASKAGAGSRKGNNATANEMARWQSRVQSIMARQVRSGGSHRIQQAATLRIAVNVSGSGAITGASLLSSTGDAKIDAAVLAKAQRARLPAPPDGVAQRLNIPIRIDR